MVHVDADGKLERYLKRFILNQVELGKMHFIYISMKIFLIPKLDFDSVECEYSHYSNSLDCFLPHWMEVYLLYLHITQSPRILFLDTIFILQISVDVLFR